MSICILAIESSCDDTAASVCKDGLVLSNEVAGQQVHKAYGGVVPELASRAHQQNIVPVVDIALKKAQCRIQDLQAIAFTEGPGLIGSLLVGASFAKGLALSRGIPIIGVNHMQAHVLAHFIEEPKPIFPFLCLTVSGGHTQIVLVKDYLDMEVVGETIDDAAGEAFDKAAKMLGLPYPGGPLIDSYAQKGNPKAFTFAKPKAHQPLDYSFSGLKTSILYFLKKAQTQDADFISKNLSDLCASIQYTIVDILINRLIKATKQYQINQVAIAGGVSANRELRSSLKDVSLKYGWDIFIPDFQYCTDNAAMIGITAYYKYLKKQFSPQDVEPKARYLF